MNKIYIVFSYTGTLFSKFIKLFINEKYVHVSISLDKNLTRIYSFGRQNPKHILPSGFVEEKIDLINKIFKNSICQIYELEVDSKKYNLLLQEIQKYRDTKDLYKYNVIGLPFIHFNKVFHREYHYVCSQFVGKIIKDTNIWDFKKDYSLVKPMDLRKIDGFTLLYEGKINDYLKYNLQGEKNERYTKCL